MNSVFSLLDDLSGGIGKRGRSNLLALGIVAVVVWFAFGPHSGETDRASEIVAAIGADGCSTTGYMLLNRLDGSKTRIYTCMVDGAERCVTEQNGLVNDVTVEAQLLFANALGHNRPSCAS